jgi:hypothetical protein
MDAEQSNNFNERLSQWVANQGFWFQIRYSMSGSGLKGRAMIQVLRLGFRLLLFLLIVAVGGWVYLIKRADSLRFHERMREDLQAGLSASVLEVRGGKRFQGQFEVSRMAAEGGENTFFTALEARNVRFKMGLLDGMMGLWQPGIISIARLDLDLRAGTDDGESARKLADALFRKSDKVDVSAFEVADATVRWGYSERTEGAIESSVMNVQRTESGWRIIFKGGFFRQNWLNKLEIVNLVVVCDADGLVFEKAELKQGESTVNFPGLRLTGGERPQVAGTVKIRHLGLDGILPAAARRFVEGTLSGDFRVFGSTNSADGIGFEGLVVMDGKDVITLREQIYLLKALSVVDYSRNYHRVDFREGSFQIKTLHSGMELSDVNLKAEDLFTMEGKMSVRLPTQEEIQKATAQGADVENSPLFGVDELTAHSREAAKVESSFTLKRAAQEARRVKEGTQSAESLTLFDRLDLAIEMRRLQNQAAERMSRMLRYGGEFRITIPGDAFDRGPKLQERYPVDAATGRIPIKVPIEGYLYELTLKQAEETYQLGQR